MPFEKPKCETCGAQVYYSDGMTMRCWYCERDVGRLVPKMWVGDALIVTGGGTYLKCTNEEDAAKVVAAIHAHDYNSMSAEYVGISDDNN